MTGLTPPPLPPHPGSTLYTAMQIVQNLPNLPDFAGSLRRRRRVASAEGAQVLLSAPLPGRPCVCTCGFPPPACQGGGYVSLTGRLPKVTTFSNEGKGYPRTLPLPLSLFGVCALGRRPELAVGSAACKQGIDRRLAPCRQDPHRRVTRSTGLPPPVTRGSCVTDAGRPYICFLFANC